MNIITVIILLVIGLMLLIIHKIDISEQYIYSGLQVIFNFMFVCILSLEVAICLGALYQVSKL